VPPLPPLLLVPDPPDEAGEELSSPPQAVSARQVNAISATAFIGITFQTNRTNEARTRESRRAHRPSRIRNQESAGGPRRPGDVN
ncbi:hypothetical protein ABXK61_34390, partial [Burkholderia sola]|uniref:hypothetical protein n=1 Tax=Burkholderia TaxID=32008 RepID=UPI001AE7F114